jgi:hypothetical protein
MTPDELEYLSSRTGAVPARDTIGVVMVDEQGRFMAGAAAERWTETSCFMHILIDNPLALRRNVLLDEISRYIFTERDKRMILTTTSSLNARSLKFQFAIGFKEVARIPDAFDNGEDMVFLQLTREAWLKYRGH